MINHPPVPHDCKRFCYVGSPCIHIKGDIFEHDPEIVACFVRCAWLDLIKDEKDVVVIAMWQDFADQWASWGKKRAKAA